MIISVDVEADGPCPGLYSMVSFGAVVVEPGLERTFYGQCRPLAVASWDEHALAVSGHERAETLLFPFADATMKEFHAWLESLDAKRLIFASDNNGFDWQFINYYFHLFGGVNPFGHSSMNIGSLYKGAFKSMFVNFKHLRETPHTHHPVDDAKGNAEALMRMRTLACIEMSFK